jgi:bifunctional DNA-binding transcriptional regulator/antitoxin component of YhaV-PrlF toxin-antitoxin module
MAQIRVRKKHQITLPIRIAESANIKLDDMLEVTYNNGVVTLIPVSRKNRKESAMSYAGIARGVWGNNTLEIEAEIKSSRDSWER